jgi:hypothetical protein
MMRCNCALTAIAVSTVALSSWAAAGQAPITLEVRTFVDENLGRGLAYSGAISSGDAGDRVSVLAKVCPRDYYRLVATATTGAGGFWRAETVPALPTATFRARWRGRFSHAVRFWSPIDLRRAIRRAGASGVPNGAVTVALDTTDTQQNLTRKVVELQRYHVATWTWLRHRRANLRRSLRSPFMFTATFRRLRHGLSLRILVPKKTAAPCYLPQASQTFSS